VLVVVVTVSVDVPLELPVIETELDPTAQVGGGVPPPLTAHDNATVPVYPPVGVTVMEDVAFPPALTEFGFNGASATE
jgi:hypothetical protein